MAAKSVFSTYTYQQTGAITYLPKKVSPSTKLLLASPLSKQTGGFFFFFAFFVVWISYHLAVYIKGVLQQLLSILVYIARLCYCEHLTQTLSFYTQQRTDSHAQKLASPFWRLFKLVPFSMLHVYVSRFRNDCWPDFCRCHTAAVAIASQLRCASAWGSSASRRVPACLGAGCVWPVEECNAEKVMTREGKVQRHWNSNFDFRWLGSTRCIQNIFLEDARETASFKIARIL